MNIFKDYYKSMVSLVKVAVGDVTCRVRLKKILIVVRKSDLNGLNVTSALYFHRV